MAKANFNPGQRVFVRPVGTWAKIERVVPVWANGVPDPVRITYDCGLGRTFSGSELEADLSDNKVVSPAGSGVWRVMRGENRIRANAPNHPVPGSHPLVRTAAHEWGGWRVPASEYDLDPDRIERQAKLIAAAPRLKRVAEKLTAFADTQTRLPEALKIIAQEASIALEAIEGFEAVYRAREEKRAHATPAKLSQPKGANAKPASKARATG